MGEYFQTIVDTEVDPESARQTADRLVGWLVELLVIEPDLSPCVLGLDNLGYAPLNYERVAQTTPGAVSLHEYANRGLEVRTGKQIAHTWTQDVTVACPVCAIQYEGDWIHAVGDWYEDRGPGELRCGNCGSANSVINWSFDPAWGFGYLAFTFWNWPILQTSFVADLQRQLGHRIVLVRDKV